MTQEEAREALPIRSLAIMRICWHIMNRQRDKPLNECAEAILKSLEEEFGYRLIPELTLLTDEENANIELPCQQTKECPENMSGFTTSQMDAKCQQCSDRSIAQTQLSKTKKELGIE